MPENPDHDGQRLDGVEPAAVDRSFVEAAEPAFAEAVVLGPSDDDVDTLLRDDGETLYRRCRVATHHHHLVCRSCGATVEVDGPAVESWADRLASEHGYDEVSHTLEIFGRCAACRG